MRILSLGTDLFAPFWRDAGHRVIVVVDREVEPHPDTMRVDFFSDPRRCEPMIASIAADFRPDVIFQGDHSTPLIHCGLENADAPTAWYSIDTHLHLAWHAHYAALFDLVFCAQKNRIPYLRAYQPNVEWLILFCRQTSDFVPWAEREHRVAFVGTLDAKKNAGRVGFFERLRQRGVPLHAVRGEYAPVYRSAWIVVNQAAADDLNLRFFEATGCGALLVTERLSHSMSDILEEEVDFLGYRRNDADECVEKIEWALAHPERAEAMARRAWEKITSAHTARRRAAEVASRLQRLSEEARASRRDRSAAIAHTAWTYDYCSRLTLPEHLTDYFTETSERLALQARESEAGRPWALLLLAGRALEKGNHLLTNFILSQIVQPPMDRDFRQRHLLLSAETATLSGNPAAARRLLDEAKAEFPDPL